MIVAYLLCSGRYENRKGYIIFCSLFLIFLSAFRHAGVGKDTYGYIQGFLNAQNKSWLDVTDMFWERYINPDPGIGKDPMFYIFERAMSVVCHDEHIYLFVIAIIIMVPLGVFVYKNTINTRQVLIFYLFYLNYFYTFIPNAAIRQTIACSFALWAFIILQSNHRLKILRFITLIIAGSFFHKSVLITLLMLPLIYLKRPQFIAYTALLGFALMLFFYKYVGFILVADNGIYDMYSNSSYYESTGTSRPIFVILVFALAYLVQLLAVGLDKNRVNNMAYAGSAMTIVLLPLIWMNPSAVRIIVFTGVWFAIMLPKSIDMLPRSYRQLVYYAFILILVGRFLVTPLDYWFCWDNPNLNLGN